MHHIIPRLTWIWVNLLEFNLANQTVDADEDAMNKPWRPIPSKRISQSTARSLRWILLPICFVLSCAFRVPLDCLVIHIGNICYHDFGVASHWVGKNLVNGLGLAAFNGGASMIMHRASSPLLCNRAPFVLNQTPPDYSPTGSASRRDIQILNFLLISTTIHAQDFRDVVGDHATGRLTIPLAYPRASRLSMLILLPAWSLFLCLFWHVPAFVSAVVCAFATYVGLQFCWNGGTSAKDNAGYRDYNVRRIEKSSHTEQLN